MTPTPELRFVERTVYTKDIAGSEVARARTIHVLQQKWEGSWEENIAACKYIEEWRDVPLVKEDV